MFIFLLFLRKQPCTENQADHLLITVCTFKLQHAALDEIWLSGKFHPVLCMEHEILKIKFSYQEILKSIFR